MPINAALRRQLGRQGADFTDADLIEIFQLALQNTEQGFSFDDDDFSQIIDLSFKQTRYVNALPHSSLIAYFKTVVGTLQQTEEMPDPNDPDKMILVPPSADDVKVLRIRASATVPTPNKKASNNRDVYNLFYRYGVGVDNDDTIGAVDEHGETFIGVVTIVFEAFDPPNVDLLDTSAMYHDAMVHVADQLRLTPENDVFGISDVRLGVQSLTSTAASIERLEFTIEIDWYYPI